MNSSIPNTMAERLKALILILLAIFFAQKFVSGDLYYYIGPRFGWLTIVAVVLLIALAGAYNLVDPSQGESNPALSHVKVGLFTLIVVSLPLVVGVLVPASPLTSSAVANRGVTTTLTASADQSADVLTIVPSQRNVLDWVRAMSANPDPTALNGQQADLVGFVYRDIQFSDEQFMVARFTLSCCVADATAIGVVVQSEEAASLQTDTWVRVTGTFEDGAFDGSPIPVLVADSIEPVEPLEQPYLFQ